MYTPPHFREENPEVQHALIRANPLGLLVSAGTGGLMANHIPFMLHADEGGTGILRAHLAKANTQWRELENVQDCLVVFQGPQAYVTPSWYPTKRETGKVVPTWNYVTVQVWGQPRVIDDAAWLRTQIEQMTNNREQPRAQPWEVSDAPSEFIASQIKGIVGIEIEIRKMEGKWKVSQNRSESDKEGVYNGLRQEGPRNGHMADLVAQRGKLRF
jgi:transcriptional regulator